MTQKPRSSIIMSLSFIFIREVANWIGVCLIQVFICPLHKGAPLQKFSEFGFYLSYCFLKQTEDSASVAAFCGRFAPLFVALPRLERKWHTGVWNYFLLGRHSGQSNKTEFLLANGNRHTPKHVWQKALSSYPWGTVTIKINSQFCILEHQYSFLL